GLALNFASTHQTENPRGFSEVVENKQLLIAIVGKRYLIFFSFYFWNNFHSIPFENSSSDFGFSPFRFIIFCFSNLTFIHYFSFYSTFFIWENIILNKPI